MSPNQTSLYWRTWGRVKKTLVELGGYSSTDADAERYAIHVAAFGRDKSSKDFTNRDLDTVLDHFKSYLVINDGPSKAPARADSQPVARLIYSIDQLGLPEPYIATIVRAKFNTSEWRKLSEREITGLYYTLKARSRALKKKTRPGSQS